MNIKKAQTENVTKYTDEDANSTLLAAIHQRADNDLWMLLDFTGQTVRTNLHEDRASAEAEADVRFFLAESLFFPKGTPEYAEYERNLQIELAKFAAGEAPYEYSSGSVIDDAIRNAAPTSTVEELAANLRSVLDRHGDRDPDPEGGSLAQLTIAAEKLLSALGV